jgi:hypothetical protein
MSTLALLILTSVEEDTLPVAPLCFLVALAGLEHCLRRRRESMRRGVVPTGRRP